MNDLKIIEASASLKTDDPDVFFEWFESKFVVGFEFGFGDSFFLMSTGRLIPLRKGNTLTIYIGPILSELKIKAIRSPHGGTDVKAVCKTQSPEFESLFKTIWNEIAAEEPVSPFSELPEIIERHKKVRDLKEKGYTDKEIANKTAVSIRTVHRDKQKIGLVNSHKKGH